MTTKKNNIIWKEFKSFTEIYDKPEEDEIYNKLISFFDMNHFYEEFDKGIKLNKITGTCFCFYAFACYYFINEFTFKEKKQINLCVDLINSHDKDNIIMAANILVKLKPIK